MTLLCVLALAGLGAPQEPADRLAPLLRQYCVRCHGPETSKGDLDLEKLLKDRPLVRHKAHWLNVREQVRNGVMPPEGKAQPSTMQRAEIVALLDKAIHHFDYSGVKDPGRVPPRRLTHEEYNNTLRDLLGVDLRPADAFPADLSGMSGFTNSANTLFLQTALLERYIDVADRVLEKASLDSLGFGASADRDSMRRFLERAYRRPVAPEELDRVLRRAGSDGRNIRQALATALVSPHFLMKVEKEPAPGTIARVSAWELASRLSYFLWASMPDDELQSLARNGKILEPNVLAAQVTRMLADPRADTLGDLFASQWLGFQHLGSRRRPDPIDKPEFTDSLYEAMRAESAMFFTFLVRDNRPVTELITAEYTYLNGELARYYRLRGLTGERMQRVRLKSERRGGIFGHASLLMITAFPGRTSPVLRGKWILADLLGTPPPPPPPNAGDIPEEILENDRISMRKKLELHRRNPTCAACHRQIDPLGFSLESYDEYGRWRSRRDVKAQLPDGTEFEGPAGLKKVLVEKRKDDLLRQATSRLLAYALGRQLEWVDEPALRKILAALKTDGERWGVLVREIVKSYPFQHRRAE